MSLLKSLQSLSLCNNSSECAYIYLNFLNDVQVIFDEISRSKDIARVSVHIMKGSIYLKGDYFIPLKSNESFQLNCEELFEKLKNLSYILNVEVDSNFNLLLCMKRTAVYQATLKQISEFSSNYGMFETNKSVLVLIDADIHKSYNCLRNTLVAEHVMSILAANKVDVVYSDDRCDSSCIYKNCTRLVCSKKCSSLKDICKELELKINISKYKTDSKIDSISLDAEKYIKENSLQKKYGKVLSKIILSRNNLHEDLYRTAYIKHLLTDHITKTPDYILHIGSQSHSIQIYKSGMLLEMLEEELSCSQVYIFNQNVHFEDENKLSADDFVLCYKSEVQKAMEHKYGEFTTTDEIWLKRIESLVDSAVKFEFLKVNHNSILNLKNPSCQSGGKRCGIFVQYNFARLSNLFRNFETKVKESYYQSLHSLENVDFSLLKLEEEWNLFHFVLSFPQIIKTLLESLMPQEKRKTRFYFNKICVVLQDLCRYLSLYYSKIRILAGPQVHLQKIMNARLWLLKGIHQVFANSFSLLNVNGLDLM